MSAGVISGEAGQCFGSVVPERCRTSIVRAGPQVCAIGTLSVVMSLVFLFSRESVHDQIGQGGLTRDGELTGIPAAPAADSPAGRAERAWCPWQLRSARRPPATRSRPPGAWTRRPVRALPAGRPGG